MMTLVDLHLHSVFSDGQWTPAAIVQQAKALGLFGLSLTDHNGVWGIDEACAQTKTLGLNFLEGIEVSASFEGFDVHVLGYSRKFDRHILGQGLEATRGGYERRMQQMVERCQKAGYDKVSWEVIVRNRSNQLQPLYVLFDLVSELERVYGLSPAEAHQTVVKLCYLPYGSWALSIEEAARLIHQAGGVAILAHPGIIEREHGSAKLHQVFKEATKAEIDGVEVYHPDNNSAMRQQLVSMVEREHWLVAGGSDWHGPFRLPANNEAFGKVGVSRDQFETLLQRLS